MDFRQAAAVLTRQEDQVSRSGFLDSGHLTGSILAGSVFAHTDEQMDEFAGQIDSPSLVEELQWHFDMVSTKTITLP
jgi:hypothetical protein